MPGSFCGDGREKGERIPGMTGRLRRKIRDVVRAEFAREAEDVLRGRAAAVNADSPRAAPTSIGGARTWSTG